MAEQLRYLVHFSDGGAGMREFGARPEPGDVLSDCGQTYVVKTSEHHDGVGGFGHVWADLVAEER